MILDLMALVDICTHNFKVEKADLLGIQAYK